MDPFRMKRNSNPLPLRVLMFRALAVIVGIAAMVIGYQESSRISRIQRTGIEAVVEPIQDYTERTSRGSKTYSAEFHFTTAKGDKVQRRRQFPKEVLEDFEYGRPVTIRYDRADPYEFIFAKEEPSYLPFLFGVGIIIAAFVFIRAPAE
jgi:hypothetical protein